MIADSAILRGSSWIYYLDGKVVSQKKYERRYPPQKILPGQSFACPKDSSWPMVSKLSLACDPSDVLAMNERNKAEGLTGVMYRGDGSCEISDEAAYKRLRRFEGFRHQGSYTE